MLRNYIKKLLPTKPSIYRNVWIVFVAIVVVFIASTKVTYAIGIPGINLWDVVTEITAYIVNTCLAIASWFVAITGMLLNVSITLTLHIKDFLASTPAIYTVWKTIRDITGLFIIFALLYASIRMILGRDAKLGSLIVNIVVAGVLINFSFFVTAFLIDTSNIVSLQLYKAITPGQPSVSQLLNNSKGPGTELTALVSGLMDDGGLSAVFMQSLQIQSAFHPNSYDLSGERGSVNMAPFRIVFIGITGIVIMITAGLSFLFAALAFVVRLILLLFLLAFSPIWCAAFVVPQLKEYAGEWTKTLVAQLTFMPAYLLLMYVALKIITGSQLFNSGAYGGLWKGLDSSSAAPTEFITFAINAVFIIFMLNVPLLVAIKLGASTGKLLDGNKLGADVLWKKVGSWSGRNTLGAGAAALNENSAMRRFYANNPNLGLAVSKGLSKVSGAGFGEKKGSYDAVLKQRKKDIEALNKRIGEGDDKKLGGELQQTFRSALGKRSILNLMMKDRANVDIAKKLNKKASDETAKKAGKDARKKLGEIRRELEEARKPPAISLTGRLAAERDAAIKARIEQLEAEEAKLLEVIEAADEVKERERDERLLGKIEEIGGAKDKDEKSGDKDKPKT